MATIGVLIEIEDNAVKETSLGALTAAVGNDGVMMQRKKFLLPRY